MAVNLLDGSHVGPSGDVPIAKYLPRRLLLVLLLLRIRFLCSGDRG